MSSLSKEEYLKRYLSPQENGVKPKKKRKKRLQAAKKVAGFKIVDDDVSWDTFTPKSDEFDEVNDKLLTSEERPMIENVDARTEEVKKLDEYRKSKMWKKLGTDENKETKQKKKSNKFRHDSDSDLDELPRNKSKGHDDSDSDLDDVPRKQKRKSKRHDSDSDLDVRRSLKNPPHSDSDLDDVPRKVTNNVSHKLRHDSDSDMDLPRKGSSNVSSNNSKSKKRHDSDSDLELPRDAASSNQPFQKKHMQGGGRGGLTSVDLLRLEMKKLEKKETAMKKMAEEYKGTETVYRERGTGKKRDLSKEKKDDEEEALRKKKKEEQYNKWGKGLKQAEMRADAIADTLHESNKSLTRYNDDEDLEAMRKAAIRDGDPMAEYILRKKQKEKGNEKERPKYRGPMPAPNRFNILPGYRWDGVDRSNGFEKRYFQSLSDNQALKDEYYKWSVGDM